MLQFHPRLGLGQDPSSLVGKVHNGDVNQYRQHARQRREEVHSSVHVDWPTLEQGHS